MDKMFIISHVYFQHIESFDDQSYSILPEYLFSTVIQVKREENLKLILMLNYTYQK